MKGFTLIEVLVTIFLVAVGMMGFAALQIRTMNLAVETQERAAMSALVTNMSESIRSNHVTAYNGGYELGDIPYGLREKANCSALVGPTRDVCQWNNAIQTNELATAVNRSAIGAVGCLSTIEFAETHRTIRIAMAWSTRVSTGAEQAPGVDCGTGIIPEDYRRALYRDVRVRNVELKRELESD